MKSKVNCVLNFTEANLRKLCDCIYEAMCSANIEGLWWKEKYRVIQNMNDNDLIEFAIAVGGFSTYYTCWI